MISKNMVTLMRSFSFPNRTYGNVVESAYFPVTDVTGVVRYVSSDLQRSSSYQGFPYKFSMAFLANGYTNGGIIFGSGTTAPAATDYAAESAITGGKLDAKIIVYSGKDDNNRYYSTILCTVLNVHTEDVSIGEACLIGDTRVSSTEGGGTSSAFTAYFLLDRTLLATPVVLHPGDYTIIAYTIKAPIL